MADRLFGVETEYALTALDRRGASIDLEPILSELLQLAKETLPHLPDRASMGMFLQNGARFYVDCGNHPEFSTPECSHPDELVRYVRAGDQIIRRLATALKARQRGLQDVMALRSNVDYDSRATWGSHESYLHRANPADLPAQLVPHFVSRIIYTGAGGFDSTQSHALRFTLSPRVWHLVRAISPDSTSVRGIFHCKDESLSADGYHRLHVLCGESLCSDLATWLRVGATALVVALVDAGVRPGDMVQLRDPLDAMRQFAADPTCRVSVEAQNGEPLTALSIQRHYLALARQHIGHEQMPAWAEEVCDRWGAILDRLDAAPESLATTLDWAIKLKLYRARVQQRGFAWDTLPLWGQVDSSVRTTQLGLWDDASPLPGPNVAEAERSEPSISEHGFDPEQVSDFLRLREELFEIDTRFAQVGEGGIFTALDHAGVLSHRTAAPESVERAIETPPAVGRARLRGERVRKLHGHTDRYVCDWRGVWDSRRRRTLDLLDPFATRARWGKWSGPADRALRGPLGRMLDLHSRAIATYHEYRYGESLRMFRRAARTPVATGEQHLRGDPAFWHATVLHNMGRLRQAAVVLDRLVEESVGADVVYKALTRRALIAVELPQPLHEIEGIIGAAGDRMAALGHANWQSRILLARARLLEARGMYDDAFAVAVEGLDRHREEPNGIAVATHMRVVLTSALRCGRLRDLDAYLAAWSSGPNQVMVACGRSALARMRGQAGDSLRASEQAADLEESRSDRTVRGLFHETHSRALLCAGDLERARTLLDRLVGLRNAEVGGDRYAIRLLWADYQLTAARQSAGLPGLDPATGLQLARVLHNTADGVAPAYRLSLARRSYERARREGRAVDALLDCNVRDREIQTRLTLVELTRSEMARGRPVADETPAPA